MIDRCGEGEEVPVYLSDVCSLLVFSNCVTSFYLISQCILFSTIVGLNRLNRFFAVFKFSLNSGNRNRRKEKGKATATAKKPDRGSVRSGCGFFPVATTGL